MFFTLEQSPPKEKAKPTSWQNKKKNQKKTAPQRGRCLYSNHFCPAGTPPRSPSRPQGAILQTPALPTARGVRPLCRSSRCSRASRGRAWVSRPLGSPLAGKAPSVGGERDRRGGPPEPGATQLAGPDRVAGPST